MKKFKLFLAAFAAMVGLSAQAQTWTGNEVAAGDFYLYNIGTGKWLTSGNSWGTQATLVEAGGFCSTLEISDGKYAIKNTETRTNNKAAGPGYLGTNAYMDGESAAYFTFTEVTGRGDGVKAYYIQNGTNNLAYSGTGTVVSFGTETGDNAQWVLVTKADRLAAMANATEANPVDATFLLKNPGFGRYQLPAYDAAWTFTFPGGTNKNNAGDNTNFCVESYHAAFDFAQTIADAPNGYYAVRGQAFYRQDGSNNTDLPYFYVGSAKINFPAKTGSEGSMTDASNSFKSGSYQTEWSDKATYAGGGLKVGTHLDNNTALWCIWDNIQIQYYGPIDLTVYATELANAVAAAQAYESQLPAAVYSPIATAITENNKTYTTEAEYTAAITAINNAVSTYASAAIIADYARYNTVKAAAVAIASGLDTTEADNAVEAATTEAAIDAAIATLRAAFLAELPNVTVPTDGLDVTAVMVDNASVAQNTNYWTIANLSSTGGSAGVCSYDECEFYNRNFKFYQTLALTTGTWEFGVTGFHRAGNHSTYFYAGEDKILIPGVESSVVNNMAGAKTYFDNGNGKVALKFLIETAGDVEIGIDNQDTETDKWTIFRNFTLKYYGPVDYSIYDEQWAAAVAAANAAKTAAANANVTGAELTALDAAIADAPDGSSKANYLEKIQALEAATQTFTAAAASYDAYVAYKNETVTLFGSDLEVAAPTTAAEAVVAVQNLNIAQYNKVASDYTYSLNGLIGDFGSWTGTATVAGEAAEPNYLTNEHWSGATHAYYEQASAGWGNANGWTIKYEKTCKLPAGSYVIKVAARSSVDTQSTVSCSATSTTISLPNVGAASKGITTAGVASWSDSDTFANSNNGFGWQWRFLPFTLTEETEVTMTFYAETSKQYNWMSIADGELLSATDIATAVAYNEAATNTIEDVDVANVTVTRNIKVGFNTVVLPFTLTANQVTEAFGTGAEVYNFSENSTDANDITVNFNKGDGSITANVPVLVKATTASTEQVFKGVQVVAATEAKVAGTNANFVGVYAPASVALGDYFIGQGALYKSAGNTSIKAFRAYIDVDNTSEAGVKMFIEDGGIETAISEINGDAAEQGAIFNLAGQRVNKAQKGVFIVNGKKVLVK